MMSSPQRWKNSFTSRFSPAPPDRQNLSFPPVMASRRAFWAASPGTDWAATASFSQMTGTLMKTDGDVSGSLPITESGSVMYDVKPSVLPRQASPKPKMWLMGSQSRSTAPSSIIEWLQRSQSSPLTPMFLCVSGTPFGGPLVPDV